MAPPFVLGRLDHVVLRVADMTRSLAFYKQVLGCRLVREVESIGLVQLRAGGSLIDLVPAGQGASPPGSSAGNMEHVALTIQPFEPAALAAHFAAHGIEIGEPARRFGAEGFGPSIYLQDPDGNQLELKGPAEHA